jgi:hypothetical protein
VRTKKVVNGMAGETGEAIRKALLAAGEEWEIFKDRK